MLAGSKKKTNIGVLVGLVLLIAGRASMQAAAGPTVIGALLSLAGMIVFVWGCTAYIRGKGHHPAFGLLGLLSIFGLLALFFFTDKYKCCEKGGVSCTHGSAESRLGSSRVA
jgi:uncharacterized membrane protein